jgi:hypothetical protein
MKNYVTGTLKIKTVDPPKKGVPTPDNDNDEAGAGYPSEDGVVHMIFGGTPARPRMHQEGLIQHEIYNAEPVAPSYLKWSETPNTFDHTDHPTACRSQMLPARGGSAIWDQAGPQGADGRRKQP